MNPNEKQVMNMRETSIYTGLSRSCLWKKTSKKSIPFFKMNGSLYFKTEEIKAWLLQNRVVSLDDLGIENTLAQVQEQLGHADLKVTESYLNSIDNSKTDEI